MADAIEPLVADLVEWVGLGQGSVTDRLKAPRVIGEVERGYGAVGEVDEGGDVA